jgi:hypothetical protein
MKQYRFYFALYDIQLLCTEEADQQIAEIALHKKTGARGLRNIVEKILMPAMFLIPSQHHLSPRPSPAPVSVFATVSSAAPVPVPAAVESDLIQDEATLVFSSPSSTDSQSHPQTDSPQRQGQGQTSVQSRHPVFHTVVIDKRAARGERGVVLLTHQISTEEYLNLTPHLTEEQLLRDPRVRIASLDSLALTPSLH